MLKTKTVISGAAWVGLMGLFLLSCFDPPEYSNIPAIEYESVSFIDVNDVSDPDSLILVVRFKDGDGDMGLDADFFGDTLFPYNPQFFFDTIQSPTVPYYYPEEEFWMGNPQFRPENPVFITYETYRTKRYGWKSKLLVDTLPPFVKPYNCINWVIRSVNNKVDTFYFERNPYHYNFHVDFLVKNPNGTFTEFDWTKEFTYPNCGITLDGRFPILSKDLSRAAALDGKIRYSMGSTGFNFLFSIKTLKLRVTVFDRSLNESNVVETPEFTLQQIRE
jgi:hypothetical protein